ncbi:hypothetical protein EPUS_05047 [Endocarpon pusillum Z07020]|uniref:Mannose-1-phosphate guanyltransferase n=1 Tax=Endocarpon pusillum (strain Z07020 / HMAS-L-300199) TaxID=1263415 RepID=U1GM33_ENDPU|nr:uncharacterized protein EPUS_05047 [Endocarpon pusillum Z07020]ERF72966.1 hypothetical protein EPUS_05047 [Endocarpon pusillum Z07020]
MAPKPPKSSSSKGKSQGDEKEDVLQAVVIADTFETKFAPFTLERPRCLLPLANAPIIEYTLDFLAQSGVQEIFFSAGSHTDQVEKYIDESKWRLKSSPFKKFTFLKSAATSVGDVMRDLDQKGLVNGDFLAVSGDVISNFPIAEALAKHKARRQKDKNAIMTMLLREIGPRQRSRQRSIIPTFVMDPTKDRCLHYEESRPGRGSGLAFDPNLLSQAELEIRQDLVDCRIDVCTPEMLSLWSDNFDNQSPRKDFLHGVLKDYELNGKTIHTHIVNDYFASRVGDLGAYDTMSREITSRWTFPACPDVDAKYKLSRQGVYQEDGVTLARSCRVKPCSIIGRGASIGDRSVVQDSVIGRHCQIGRNVHIRHAYIWDYAVVEDDVKILRAIIGDEAVVGKGCSIGEGALISFGVRLDQGRHIPSGSRITKARSSNNGSTPSDKALVGDAGEGYCYVEEEDDEIKPVGLGRGTSGLVPHEYLRVSVYQREEFAASNSSLASTDSQDSEVHSGYGGSRSESFATTGSDDDGTDRFHHEAVHSLFERMKIGTHQDDVRVELMGLRFAQNATEDQVRRSVVNALMKYISGQAEAESFEISVAVKQSLARYGNLIQRDQSQEATAAGVGFLLEAQKDLLHRKGGEQILLHLAKELYDQDIFDEEVFSDWWTDERSESTDELRGIKEFSRQFLDWLAAADEESESESETEDEEVDEEVDEEDEE